MAKYEKQLKDLGKRKAELTELYKERRALVTERKKMCSQVFTQRSRFAIAITKNLKSTVVEYVVSVSFDEGKLSPDFEQLLKTAMNWRTAQVPKAPLIVNHYSPLEMCNIVQSKSVGKLTRIGLSPGDAEEIINTLGETRHLHQMQSCRFYDRPRISVARPVPGAPGQVLSFDKLSMGQQQSVILSIMLFSNSNHPLIIDQPEDNLDSEFIYKTFVHTLRIVKERRQVIVVTHNANIAVLGDAELIIPLRATSTQSTIRDRGGIDTPETKKLACTILEGSEQAFKRRQAIYGL